MNGFHTYCGKGLQFDFERATWLLSILQWKKLNGSLTLLCDAEFEQYAKPLFHLYDKVERITVPESINQQVFWAASKIVAYQNKPVGSVFLDLDTIVWEPVKLPNVPIVCAHYDEPNAYFTFNRETWFTPNGYSWPDWLPEHGSFTGLNMSFVRFGDEKFRDRYCREAMAFMCENPSVSRGWPYMVFAEQVIPYHLLKSKGLEPYYHCPDGECKNSYHLGGYKRKLIADESLKNDYLSRLKKRIIENHGSHYLTLL